MTDIPQNPPPAPPEEEKVEVPKVQAAFANLLKESRIDTKDGLAETIAENISYTGGETVFEDPANLAERLAFGESTEQFGFVGPSGCCRSTPSYIRHISRPWATVPIFQARYPAVQDTPDARADES